VLVGAAMVERLYCTNDALMRRQIPNVGKAGDAAQECLSPLI
jgi:hypothetical protein